ncbi:hypothetical protein CMI47_00235 [Candidatus Pacearchaeota archaeon]|nr:hypothetical protein [Candidatus Pacearchaeota archaeon]|tara:strand:- start:13129 stop:13788 length:660 start_codon:yes stop_codon:yes gene_type:complete
MAEETQTQQQEKKPEVPSSQTSTPVPPKSNEQPKKTEAPQSQPSTDNKAPAPKKEKSKSKIEEKPKKPFVIANGRNLHASKKHCVYISSFITNKTIDQAIADLQKVIAMKTPVPFKGEIPHRKGKIMSGRYPVKASELFIAVLKGLKGNAIVNNMDLDKTRIVESSSSWASRPMRRGSVQAKRTNVIIKAKESRSPQREAPQQSEEARSKSESRSKEAK